jgi:hypothetical protein
MPRIELSDDEAVVLEEILTSWKSELRMEIADTDAKAYRETLQRKERVVEGVLRRLNSTPS